MKVRAISALGLGLTLAGCWNSAVPLMPATALDAPPIAGIYQSVPSDPAATPVGYRATVKDKAVVLEKRVVHPDVADSWEADRTLSFDALSPGAWLVQSVNAAGTERNYVVMRIEDGGDIVRVLTPSCSAEQAARYGAALSGNMCAFDSYPKVLAAARTVAAAKTPADLAALTYQREEYRRSE